MQLNLPLASEEAEVLACHHAVEFALGLGFKELVIEGDNATIMRISLMMLFGLRTLLLRLWNLCTLI